ncbi:CHRD domain-containing protein [Arsenicitalea aurantiaca]|uniref:CHRD domain-containing protein n=1 Tax=Arsenicitalea aurantiaca TaxID=1783274 RepID=A0A433XF92_9HYPH|nr:CHRD domain-containing protein [Arsenicitalea aurantiaca]RUT32771.1 CHRD domain-containing protein [Arsenicitalea aurantiaca]
MLRKLHSTVLVSVVSLGLALSGAVAQDATTFGDKLGFMPVADTNRPLIGGTGHVSATLDGSTLTIEGEFEGLRSPATVLAVHTGPMAQTGPEIAQIEIEGGATDGSFSGEIELDDEQLAMLQDNSIYVVVKSERNDTGELRAWLVANNAQ